DEDKGLPTTDPAICVLHWHIHATAGRATGSDESWYHLRSQIWVTSIMLNPPSLWLTMNPCDLHDPLVQVFAGEHIDLDNFNAHIGPCKSRQAQNMANNPYTSAKFFHFLIKMILGTLFGVMFPMQQHKSTEGIFSHVFAYFGVVKSQGRGTLHLHMLLWLSNAPSMEEMELLLKCPDFHECVKDFIKASIHAYLPGLES
ncbi:hypothetical protein M404DRAFT_169587, partial [Pisolithus tinctorius Marx 270]